MKRQADMPRYSIVIPVLHEAGQINALIDHLDAMKTAERREIIVVDGSPAGDTLGVIRSAGVVRVASPPGRAVQMNLGAETARGNILLFLHADTRLPAGALERISEALAGEAFVGGAFDLRIASDRSVFRLIEAAASARSRLTRIPYGDQAVFFRKAFFEAIGGYRDIPLMEDIEIMRRVKKGGWKIRILKERVNTSPRRWEKEGVWRCTLRNWMLSTLFYLGVSPGALSRFYRHGRDAYGQG